MQLPNNALLFEYFYHETKRLTAWRRRGFSAQKCQPTTTPNWKTELEYIHVTPHDAKRVLAIVVLYLNSPNFSPT
jgi:hypothetical protein